MSGSDSDMGLRMIFLVIFLGLVRGGFSQQCNDEEYREMQNKHRDCTEPYYSSPSLPLCEKIQKIATVCGETWKACHRDKQVLKEMTGQYIQGFINQHESEAERQELENCQVVKEFRYSGRTYELPPEEKLCSDNKTTEVQNQNQKCSHDVATSVYEAISDITNPEVIKDLLCEALKKISNKCISLLSKCYAKEDFKQMRGSSLEEMKEFLVRIVDGKLAKNALDNCKAMVETAERTEIPQVIIPQVRIPEASTPQPTTARSTTTPSTTTPSTTTPSTTTPSTTSRTLEHRSVIEPEEVTVKVTTTTTPTPTTTTTTTTQKPITASAKQSDPRGGSGSVRSPWQLVIVSCVILGIRTFT